MKKLELIRTRHDIDLWIRDNINSGELADIKDRDNINPELKVKIEQAIQELTSEQKDWFWYVLLDQSEIKISNSQQEESSEGLNTIILGYSIIGLSVLSAAICIVVFGRVPKYADYDFIKTWSPAIIGYFIGAGLFGMAFGYLITKVGSVLRHLEALNRR